MTISTFEGALTTADCEKAKETGSFQIAAQASAERHGRRMRKRWKAALEAANERWNGRAETISDNRFSYLTHPAPYDRVPGLNVEFLEMGLAAYVAPYVREAAERFLATAVAAESAGILGAVNMVAPTLFRFRDRLSRLAEQTSVLLFNVALRRGLLTGENPDERKIAFGDLLRNPAYREECRSRYPIVDETLHLMTQDAIGSWDELFDRLTTDWDALQELVPGGLIELTELIAYAGDPHNRGRSVTIVKGLGGAVVYKPRSLDTDIAFGRSVAWIDTHLGLQLAHPRLLPRQHYGWTAFIHDRNCATMEEVTLCHERIGALVGLFFLLGGSDLHYENIICDGAHPFIIDAEALLTAPPQGSEISARRWYRVAAATPICTLYLPTNLKIEDNDVDVSAAGYRAGQHLVYKGVTSGPNDDAKMGPVESKTPASANLPKLDGVPQSAFEHVEAIARGFRASLEAMFRHRKEFLGNPDLFPTFAAVESRYIPRPTFRYGLIAKRALHPHCCADRDAHDVALSVLAPDLQGMEAASRSILAADIMAMRRGDVPFFKGSANSTSAWTSDGDEVPDVFQEKGHEFVARRLRQLSRRKIEHHVSIVRLAFSARAFTPGMRPPAQPRPADFTPSGIDCRVDAAKGIGTELLQRAIRDRGRIAWVGRGVAGSGLSARLIGSDIYSGVAGIGIFFAELARRTGDLKFRRAAADCLRTIRENAPFEALGMGLFDGISGTVFADIAISRALQTPVSPALSHDIKRVEAAVGGDGIYDIIAGSAGALLAMLRAREEAALTEDADKAAHACARHLIDKAEAMDVGIGWKMPSFDMPLTGVAHGVCGIALALAEYAAVFDSDEAWNCVYRALDYTRDSFSPETGLWRDLRSEEESFPIAWCHGAPGMVLARQQILALGGARAPDLEELVSRALDAIADAPPPQCETLCHGVTGNWEPLWRGSERHRAAATAQALMLAEKLKTGIVSRGDLSEPTPDLMNGLAGIGLQLLRSIDRSGTCIATVSL